MTAFDTDVADDALVAALAAGLSYEQAAKATGCSKSTVVRRMRTPHFRDGVAQARAEHMSRMRGRLLCAQPAAVEVLTDLMMNAKSDADRIRAARSILEAQRRDPYLEVSDVNHAVRAIIDFAMRFVAEGDQAALLGQLRVIR